MLLDERNKKVLEEVVVATQSERRVIGTITKLSEEGWGFISSKEIKFTRIFFHWSSLRQDTLRFPDLKLKMKVEFTPVELKDKGFRAIKIKVILDENGKTDNNQQTT